MFCVFKVWIISAERKKKKVRLKKRFAFNQSTQIACSQTKEINNIKISRRSWFVVIIIWEIFFVIRPCCRQRLKLVFFWIKGNVNAQTAKPNQTKPSQSKTAPNLYESKMCNPKMVNQRSKKDYALCPFVQSTFEVAFYFDSPTFSRSILS